MSVSRRRFFFGVGATLLAAPAIVRVAANLMPVSTAAQPNVLEFTCSDLTLSIERFSEKILKPQMIKLAQQIDEQILAELSHERWPWSHPSLKIPY